MRTIGRMSIVPWRERKLRDRWLAGATTAILIGMLAPGIMFWSAHRAHAAPVQPAPSQSAMRFPLIAWVDDLTAGVRVYCPITQLGPNWWLAMVPPSFIPDRTHRLIWHVDYMPPGSNFSFMGSQGIVPAPTFGGITSLSIEEWPDGSRLEFSVNAVLVGIYRDDYKGKASGHDDPLKRWFLFGEPAPWTWEELVGWFGEAMADMQPLYTPSELPSSPPAYRDVWVLRERGDGDGDEGIIVLTVLRMHSRHLVAASVTS